MEHIFLVIYRFFHQRRPLFWLSFLGITAVMVFFASRLRIEEDISRFFPDDEEVGQLNYVFRNSRFADRLVVMISVADSACQPQPDSLIVYAEELASEINVKLQDVAHPVAAQVDDRQFFDLINVIQNNLPIFLEESDYARIDSLSRPGIVRVTLENNYRQLISPSGIVVKRIIASDPLGFSFLAFAKLRNLQADGNISLYENYLVSEDRRHLVFFVQPVFPSNNTGENSALIDGIDRIIDQVSPRHPELKASYFGAAAVAVGNAQQLRTDTIVTISLLIVLLAIILFGYFRRKRVPFLILIPVIFGGLFALFLVNLVQQSISIIAIAAGSIVLGIAINYSLHFLVHLRHDAHVESVIRSLVRPMTLGSATTVLAFFSLQFVNAAVLRDLGLFAGFSLIGAALCSLIFLPHLITPSVLSGSTPAVVDETRIGRIATSKPLVFTIFLLTPVFLYFASDVTFNRDISQLNYMSAGMKEAQERLESINHASLSSVYLLSQAPDLEQALRKNERTLQEMKEHANENYVRKIASVSAFIVSDSLQRIRIDRWNRFWTTNRIATLMAAVRTEGRALKFSTRVFDDFESFLTRQFLPDTSVWQSFRQTLFRDYIIEEDGKTTVVSLINVPDHKRAQLYADLENKPSQAFDRQMLANVFSGYVHADFNFIVTFTSLLVFFTLLISYGRIEITLVTFLPMLITWIWILGIMAIAGIEFNIVNVMLSTFIFGLGDDYSIFTMDGLQREYRVGHGNLQSIRTSVLLSALTTISGLGVLIFAQHPALRSIAGISIIGIGCVFIMSQTVEPFLFRWLITNRTSRGLSPMTFWGILKTIFTYGFFVTGSAVLTISGLLFRAIPVGRKNIRLLYHRLLSFFTRALVTLAPNLRVKVIGMDGVFDRPSIIIANHSSFLDILITTMLHPRLILLTNRWVWNSPVFGGVVRLADYYPVMQGASDSVGKIEERIREGYSVLVFPEGKRSPDGRINRFHKGAFFMAEQLHLPITPLLIHGASESIPKGTMYLGPGSITLKFLPHIEPGDLTYGPDYSARTRSISQYFRNEFERLSVEVQNGRYFAARLRANYLYKGPVLEWYTRIKLRLERYYETFDELVPKHARILDLGCGYGYLALMMTFLSSGRRVTGVDYDEEKIETARHCFSMNERVDFSCADIRDVNYEGYDVIVIADVLHYLLPEDQERVIRRALGALPQGGRLIIREGNADLGARHRGTRLSEFFSVQLLKFNKSANALHFMSGHTIGALAEEQQCALEIVDNTKLTSNVIFVLKREGQLVHGV